MKFPSPSLKLLLLGAVLLNSAIDYGQGPITAQMPNISPASPTVAGLMKFEEVPVNHYTGIPDISIPLYEVESMSQDISVNIALKYHPSSLPVKEVASYTGLGWSLIGGGTISRMVKGLPDESIRHGHPSGPIIPRIGIYNNNLTHQSNNYYSVIEPDNYPPNHVELRSEFLWNAFEKGIYDSEHDLYQFNFMGHTGRFYIRKNINTNTLEVVKLDNNNSLKIEFDYQYHSSHPTEKYQFIGFTIYDDKGYKYVFSDKEITTETVSSTTYGYNSSVYGSNTGNTDPITYISGYHLSEIYAPNGLQLVKMIYQDDKEIIKERSYIHNTVSSANYSNADAAMLDALLQFISIGYNVYGLLPNQLHSLKESENNTKKLKTIEVISKAKIDFQLESGRLDSNINSDASKLKGITVKNWYDQTIKKYSFDYTYQHVNTNDNFYSLRRLLLSDVKEINIENDEELNYKLSYKLPNLNVHHLREDYWGYLRRGGFGKETDPEYCTTGVLEQITLPTGGSNIFEFEPNTYSFVGNEILNEFDNSTSYTDDIFYFQSPGNPTVSNPLILPSDKDRNVFFEVDFIPTEGIWLSAFRLINDTTGESFSIDCVGMNGINDGSGTTDKFTLKANNQYKIALYHNDTLHVRDAKVTMRTIAPRVPLPTPKNFLYGGGVRIKKITAAGKVKNYNYDLFDLTETLNITGRSSGSLAFPRPVLNYFSIRNVLFDGCNTCPPTEVVLGGIEFETTTSFNNLLNIRTHGSDVGYKNVTVYEEGNGKSEYTYTSPYDYPETYYTVEYPFAPSSNFDYKRGLLTLEKHYKQSQQDFQLINEVHYSYPVEAMDEQLVYTGVRSYDSVGGCPMAPTFLDYANFIYCVSDPLGCSLGWGGLCTVENYLSYIWIPTAYGWPKLMTKINKDYTYDDNLVANVITTTERFDYNHQNKKISETTVSNSTTQTSTVNIPETLTTTYDYDTNYGGINRIGEIKKIQTKRNNTIIDTKEIEYNNAYLPQTVLVGKGELSPEPRLQFQMYDVFRNPLQVKPENGVPACYIWGYNESLPIAVIENCEYSSINPTLINEAKQASNQNNEALLLTKLENIRAAVPDGMVTTFTYKPLVGVTSVTDPKGYKTTYEYDGFGRLIKVRDMDGNLLSENDYHYKTTNP